jgi:hypothetical protein
LIEDAIEEGPGSALPISEMDWFEEVVAMMDAEKDVIAEDIPAWDWFDEVAGGDDKSRDEGTSSDGALVDSFDSDTSKETDPEGLGVISQFWPVCDVFEGANKLLGAKLGSCQDEAQVAPAIDPEGEYQGGGSTSVLSGRLPDLDAYEIPWINSTMEWCTHATMLQASAEVVACPLEEPKGGEDDRIVQVHEGCYFGVTEPLKDAEGPGIDAIYEECSSVPHFEVEEDDRCEKMDLPVAHSVLALNEPLDVKVFDPPNFAFEMLHEGVEKSPPSVVDVLVGCTKFFEGAETQHQEFWEWLYSTP